MAIVEREGVWRCDKRDGIAVKTSRSFEIGRFGELAVAILELCVCSSERRVSCGEELNFRGGCC